MGAYLYRGKDWYPRRRRRGMGRIEHVNGPSFCDIGGCTHSAAWRIAYGARSAEFCPRHAMTMMRSGKLWLGRL